MFGQPLLEAAAIGQPFRQLLLLVAATSFDLSVLRLKFRIAADLPSPYWEL